MPRRRGLRGGYPLQYQGVEAPTPPNITVNDTRAPTTADSIGYNIGDLWLQYRAGFPNTGSHDDIYMLVGLERDVAHWVNFLDSAALNTLTGNTGGAISPDGADNIDVLGDTTVNLTNTGVPASNSITMTTVSGNPIGTDYITDNGTAFPNAAGEIHIDTDQANRICGNTVLFSAAANIVSLTVTDLGGNTTIGEGAGSIAITTGTNNTGLGDFVLRAFTSGAENSMLGVGAGNAITTGSQNSGFGYLSLSSLTTAGANTAAGTNSLSSLVTGDFNTGIGNASLTALDGASSNTALGYISMNSATTAAQNTALGQSSLGLLLTGTGNLAAGINSGNAYTGAESDNILLANTGTVGESDTIRIGTQGTQTTAYCAGITGVTVANEANVVINSTTGQLGVSTGGAGVESGFMAYFGADVNNVLGNGVLLTPVIFNTVLFDTNTDYDNTTGLFTAPINGVYSFATAIVIQNIGAAHTRGDMNWAINILGASTIIDAQIMSPAAARNTPTNRLSYTASITLFLSAGDTVSMEMILAVGTQTVGIRGFVPGFPEIFSYFSGHIAYPT